MVSWTLGVNVSCCGRGEFGRAAHCNVNEMAEHLDGKVDVVLSAASNVDGPGSHIREDDVAGRPVPQAVHSAVNVLSEVAAHTDEAQRSEPLEILENRLERYAEEQLRV